MKDTISKIFNKNIWLLGSFDKIIYYFRIQNYDAALRLTTSVIDELSSHMQLLLTEMDYFNEEYQVIEANATMEMLSGLLEAQENNDYVLLADLYEVQMIPFIASLQEVIIIKEEFLFEEDRYASNLAAMEKKEPLLSAFFQAAPEGGMLEEKGYFIEFSSSGLLTLALEEKHKKYYLHSNNRIMNEAFTLANSWYSEEKRNYIIYGLGLGYYIQELAELDDRIIIEVYESDINIIQLACAFSDIGKLAKNSNVKIIYDPDHLKLLKRLASTDSETEFILHYPSVRNIRDSVIKEKMETYFIQYSSIQNQRKLLNSNFEENICHFDGIADELKDNFEGKDLYIIAAGPSLDKNFMQLKQVGDSGIILATGTVYKKLIQAGITPDYVIVSDANQRVYRQIAGMETSDIPMLFLSTAFKGFAKNYQGKKYMICQSGYEKAEKFAKEHSYNLYQTGGSVSTSALDLGIQFRCKRIIFLGLDLGYTDGFAHAAGTSRRELQAKDNLVVTQDIYGKQMYTTRVLSIYKKWIEDRIQNIKDIEFIDATEGGVRIQGMKIEKLSDVIG